MKKLTPIFILLSFVIALSACAPTPIEVIPIETVFVATLSAIQSQTAAAMPPTETPTPTLINTLRPTITPFASATNVIIILTATYTPSMTPEPTATNITSGSGDVLYSCNIVSLSPEDVYEVKAGDEFKWYWQVQNIGTTKWWPDEVYVKYADGAEIYNKERQFRVKEPTDVGEIGNFVVRMKAPKEPGTYTTLWALKKGIHRFCYATLKVVVYE